jgi:hypothetical protein
MIFFLDPRKQGFVEHVQSSLCGLRDLDGIFKHAARVR